MRREEEPFRGLVIVPERGAGFPARHGEREETLASLRGRLRRAFLPSWDLATPIAVRLALGRAAPDVLANDPRLAGIARRGGRAWWRLLGALDDALGVLIGRADALALVSRGDDATAQRAHLLSRLSRALDASLEAAGLLDPRREAERVAEHVAHADAEVVRDIVGARDVRVHGIVAWRPPDLALWRVLDAALSRVGGRASIALPVFDKPLDAERERDPLDTVIEAIAAALDDAPLTEPIAPALGDLRVGGADVLGWVRVEARRSEGHAAQGRAVADAVYAAITDGAAPEAIVVAVASEEEATALAILRAFEELDIPADDRRPARAPRSNLVAFADAVLEAAARGSSRLDVARLLRSSYVDPRRITRDPEELSAARSLRALARALEETPAAAGATPGEQLAATVQASSVRGPDERPRLAATASFIGERLARVATVASRPEHVRRARALYCDLGLEDAGAAPARAALADGPVARLDAAARARDAAGWTRLTQAMDAYARAAARLSLEHEEVTLETFRLELALAVATDALSHEALVNAGVRVVSLRDLPADQAALVVVADADAESWPEGRLRAALVPAPLEERLLRLGDPALRPLLTSGPATTLARLALGTASARRVVFTYRAADDDGAALAPAPIVAWLTRGVAPLTFRPSAPTRPLSARERLLADLACAPDRAAALAPDVARRALLERRREESFGLPLAEAHPLVATLPRAAAFAGILADETGAGARPLPASAVDRLASCVFLGFVTEVLRPRRRASAHDIADAREEGDLTHAGLEAAFKATAALWSARPRDHEVILSSGLDAADRVLDRARAASELARTVAGRARAGIKAVLAWSLADEAWDFARAEQSFGGQGDWPPLVLERAGTRVAIRGRIDRVDVAHGASAVRVIDYKTRASAADGHTARFGATAFQLALYARVATEALARAGAAGLYLGTQRLRPGDAPKKHDERWRAAHAMEDGVPSFERTVLAHVAAVREGRVEVRPFSAASCEHCDYDAVCRKPRFAPTLPTDDEAPAEEEG